MIFDRAFDQSLPDGAWDAGFVRATHDGPTSNDNGLDTGFSAHWATLAKAPYPRGAYHFAHPAGSSADEQAHRFITTVRGQNFRSGTDLWMLDVEQYNDLTGQALTNWIRSFMQIATAALGDRGFLYVGYPYFTEHGLDVALLHEYRWWIPAYGANDGVNHPLGPMPVVPVVHQFTSKPFDKSVIVDFTRWHDLFDSEVKVYQQYNPTLGVVSATEFLHPKLGVAFAMLKADGSVFAVPPAAYLGGMNGSPDFKGRAGKRIVDARTTTPKRGNSGYVIIDGADEMYGPTGLPHGPAA